MECELRKLSEEDLFKKFSVLKRAFVYAKEYFNRKFGLFYFDTNTVKDLTVVLGGLETYLT